METTDSGITFHDILKHTHSGLRWVVLILLLYAIYNAFHKKKNSIDYTQGDRKLNLFAMISCHLQLTLGLILYFTNEGIMAAWSNLGAIMKISAARHMVIEHLFGMLIALVLITIGHSKSKKLTESKAKHNKIFVFYLIGLIIILASIPWPFGGWGNLWI